MAVHPKHDTLVTALERAAQTGAALHFDRRSTSERVSLATILEQSSRWASALRTRGIRRGARVPILMPTSPAFVSAFFGTLLAGGVPVPLATPMTFGRVDRYLSNLERIVRDAEATILLTYPRIRDAIARHESLDGLRDAVTEDDLGVHHSAPISDALDPDDTAFIQYTSGTTGQPKGVVVSHRAALNNVFAMGAALGLRGDDAGVSWLPLYHDMGLVGVLLNAVAHAFDIHLLSPEAFVMQPARWLSVADRARATLSVAPNFAFDLCVARSRPDDAARLDSIRLMLNGSEPVESATVERFTSRYECDGFARNAMLPVYGMAENTLAVTFPKPGSGIRAIGFDRERLETVGRAVPAQGASARHLVSVGRPVPGTRVSIRNEAGEIEPEDQLGEVWVAGASLMDGYFRREATNAERIRDGWYRTGDAGFVFEGELFLVARRDEVIIKGGRNLYPQDLERIACEVRGVRGGAVAAFARRSPTLGTDDVIVIIETAERDPDERSRIVREVRGELLAALGVKADAIHLAAPGAIPRTTSGKPQRSACARMVDTGAFAP